MFKDTNGIKKPMSFKLKLIMIYVSGVLCLLLLVIPVMAWFSSERKLGDLQFIDTPGDLHITAGHGESLEYLDLKNLGVTDSERYCMYIVFGVSGYDASGYNLQLGYTTNNQFEYFIYPAKETSSSTGNTLVEYSTHDDVGVLSTTYYYEIDTNIIDNTGRVDTGYSGNASLNYYIWTGSEIRDQSSPGSVTINFLNNNSNAVDGRGNSVIMASDATHTDTFNTYSKNNVQDFAEPLYFQVLNIKSGIDNNTKKIMDYYILEINWKQIKDNSGSLTNDRETDTIYICVEATTVH